MTRSTTRLRLITLLAAAALGLASPATATDYYFSEMGDDNNTGISPNSPWKSLSMINKLSLAPGDRILLEGGTTFMGPILFDSEDLGSETDPIVVTSYGTGRAVVEGGSGAGLSAHNTGGISILRVKFVGPNRANNSADGIAFYNDLPGDVKLAGVHIDEVEVSGFGKNGITIGGWNKQSGFRNVRITNSVTRDNGLNGLITFAQQPHANEEVYVGFVRSYHNPGSPSAWPNSGSGILLGGVKRGLIEWSVAHDNGWLGNAGIGIWTYASTRVTIRNNRSFNNRTAGDADGSGFALDGGVTYSLMEHNYSHHNDGAGYALNQYVDAEPWFRNTVRYNVSINDGRRNSYGGIQIWSAGSMLTDADINNNFVAMDSSDGSTPAALSFRTGTRRFSVHQNTFLTLGKATLITIARDQEGLRFTGNVCWSVASWTLWHHGLTVSSARNTIAGKGMAPCFLRAQSFLG